MEELVTLLLETRNLLARENNDFAWSSWENARAALTELDAFIGALRAGQFPQALDALFAPTGPLQEVSLSSGWGEAFLALASRYDAIRGR